MHAEERKDLTRRVWPYHIGMTNEQATLVNCNIPSLTHAGCYLLLMIMATPSVIGNQTPISAITLRYGGV